MAGDVLLTERRKHERAQPGEPDLAAVGVAGKHQVDEREARVPGEVVGEVRLVDHVDDRAVGALGDGMVGAGAEHTGIAGAAEPEARARTLDGHEGIDEDRQAAFAERRGNVVGVHGGVVVTENAEALRAGERGEDVGALVNLAEREGVGERAAGDIVAGEDEQVWPELVGAAHDFSDEPGLGVLVVMDVGKLDDAEALELWRQVADGDGAADDLDGVAGVGAGVDGEADPGRRGTRAEERPAGEEMISRRAGLEFGRDAPF